MLFRSLTRGLMAYYPAHEGFGESLQDVAYRRNTIANTLTWGTAPSDNTYVWPINNQGNTGVKIPTSTFSIQTPAFYQRSSGYESMTVLAVVNTVTPYQGVPVIGLTNGTDFAEVKCIPNNAVNGNINNSVGGSTPTTTPSNTWFVVGFSLSQTTTRVYINPIFNTLNNGANAYKTSAFGVGANYFYINSYIQTGTTYGASTTANTGIGWCASLAIWNRVLSSAEIVQYNQDPYCMLQGAPDRQMGYVAKRIYKVPTLIAPNMCASPVVSDRSIEWQD